MILHDLKNYIIAHPKCSLSELAKVFHLSEDGIEAMLSLWQKKGQLNVEIERFQGNQVSRYRWIEQGELAIKVFS